MAKKSFWLSLSALLAVCTLVLILTNDSVHSQRRDVTPEDKEQRNKIEAELQQIAIVERRVTRYESLAKTGAVSKVSLDEALVELKVLGRPEQ